MNKHQAISTAIAIAAFALLGLTPATATASAAAPCGVDPHDGRLHCSNEGGVPVFHEPRPVDAVDFLDTTQSWFTCWTQGELHTGGNTTWYGTVGDRFGNFGYVPASAVHTPSAFDADPGRYGLRRC
ncbi:hypothetical protein [Nonomuraea sp. NPDC049695]|uniref:hypothetical protein n=1 Tax=Nonomuraea sp. NPDC049695 TaxID=3154734 RepID=UPI0034166DA4